MEPERARLRRLQRLERVRAIARQAVALEAAAAESTLIQLEGLAERTRRMSEDYRSRDQALTGHDLRQRGQFLAGLQGLTASTSDDAARARTLADARQQELAQAERRRAAVEDRAVKAARDLAARRIAPVLSGRRRIGTGLE